jgi:hypothetical protein
MVDEGRRMFRFDTFGSEAFWGGAIKLHETIAGGKQGGVGGGVSPKTALAVGLKVDSESLPLRWSTRSRKGRWISTPWPPRWPCSSSTRSSA